MRRKSMGGTFISIKTYSTSKKRKPGATLAILFAAVEAVVLLRGYNALADGVTHTISGSAPTATTFSSSTGWTNNAPNSGSAGDVIIFNGTNTSAFSTVLDAAITVGQISKTSKAGWNIIANASPVYAITNVP